jgi:hypothetical protein
MHGIELVCSFFSVPGSSLNDPVAGYMAESGSCVVRVGNAGAVVQLSDEVP